MKRFLFGILLLLLGNNLAAAYAADSEDARDPATIIREASTEILEVLDSRRSEFSEQPELLQDVVREHMLPLIDVEYSARLVLGRAGRGISADQLKAFADALSSILINRYSDSLIEYNSNELMEVLPLRGNNTDKLTRVNTRIKLPQGGFMPVDFAFHKTDEGWKTFDVTVEGISYVITFRNQISPKVQAEGIDKVTADIIAGNLQIDE